MPANSPDYRSTNDAYNRYSVLQREIANAKKVTKRVDQQLRVKRQVAGFEEAVSVSSQQTQILSHLAYDILFQRGLSWSQREV